MSKKNKKKYIKAPTSTDLKEMETTGASFSQINASPIKKAFDNALGEDVGELEQLVETPPVTAPQPTRKKNSFRRRVYFTIGIVFTFMSIVGCVFTVRFIGDTVKNIADNTDQKNFFSEFIFPIVVIDPPAFDNNYKLTSDIMLTSACWDIIINADKSKYTEINGYVTVPDIDVENHAAKLFGEGFSGRFDHQTLYDIETFNYDETTKSYALPVIPHSLPYIPKVEEISRIGDSFTLKVGYYPLLKAVKPENDDIEAEKYMKYVVVKRGNKYSVISISDMKEDNTTM